MIGVIMTVRTKTDKSECFVELIEQLRRDVHENEPGTLMFEVMREAEDPCVFHFIEVLADENARKRHAEAPYHKAMSAQGWACVEGEPSISECQPLGNPTQEGIMK